MEFSFIMVDSKICMPVHDALLASTPCEELHVVRNVDDMHKFAMTCIHLIVKAVTKSWSD